MTETAVAPLQVVGDVQVASDGTVTLPSGATVKIKDPNGVRHKDRKQILASMDVDASDIVKGLRAADALIALAVESWDVQFDGTLAPLPATDIDILGELTIADYDALSNATESFRKAVFPDFDPSPDKKSPTNTSSG